VAIRKEAGLLQGPKVSLRTEADYVVVDDWAERGSQALAARRLIEECGATFAGLSIVVVQLDDETRERIGRVHALVAHGELGPSV